MSIVSEKGDRDGLITIKLYNYSLVSHYFFLDLFNLLFIHASYKYNLSQLIELIGFQLFYQIPLQIIFFNVRKERKKYLER